jgi:hypothetical protein
MKILKDEKNKWGGRTILVEIVPCKLCGANIWSSESHSDAWQPYREWADHYFCTGCDKSHIRIGSTETPYHERGTEWSISPCDGCIMLQAVCPDCGKLLSHFMEKDE